MAPDLTLAIQAINRYIMHEPMRCIDAIIVRNQWIRYRSKISWYDSEFSIDKVLRECRTFRVLLDKTNAKTTGQMRKALRYSNIHDIIV